MTSANREGEGDNEEETDATPDGDPPAGGVLGARRSAALQSVAMSFEDLATVVHGNKTDDTCMKPFTRHFTKDKILRSRSKVGFVPFTRYCVKSKKVCHELGQQQRDSALEALQTTYEALVNSAEEHGLNAGIFDGRIPPVAKHTIRAADENDQVKNLVTTKSSFSAGGLWNNCGTRIGNASVVLRAQKEQLELDAKKIATQSQAKSQRRVKLLLSAQQALQKHEKAPASMIDKDWIDMIMRWVLPESNADGLLKDLRKKDVIIAKLLSLERDWNTYIPTVDTV